MPLLPPTSYHKKGAENYEEVEVFFQPCTPSNYQGSGDTMAATHFFCEQTIIKEDEEITSPGSFTQITTTNQEEERDHDEMSNFKSGPNHGLTKKNFFKRFQFLPRSRTDHPLLTIINTSECYDCTMNYLYTIADILIVQSVVQRWIAMRFLPIFHECWHSTLVDKRG